MNNEPGLVLKRTVSRFMGGKEVSSLIEISILTFNKNESYGPAITIRTKGSEGDSIMITSLSHLENLIDNLRAVAIEVFDDR